MENLNQKLLKYGIEISTQKQDELFSEVEKGDMIWALMPLKQDVLETIEVSHRIRPYLIMDKFDNTLVGYYSSSNKRNILKMGEYHELNSYRNFIDKNSFVDIRKLCYIPKSNIIDFMISISASDRQEIDHKLNILKCRNDLPLITFGTKFEYQIGDVVALKKENIEKVYYILKMENDKYHVIPVTRVYRKKTSIKNIIVDDVKFSFKFIEKTIVERNQIKMPVYWFDKKYIPVIERRLKEFEKMHNRFMKKLKIKQDKAFKNPLF